MRKIGVDMILSLLLYSIPAFADTGMIRESDIGKQDGITIYYNGRCPKPCVPLKAKQKSSDAKPRKKKIGK
jgi:hypothetical protein